MNGADNGRMSSGPWFWIPASEVGEVSLGRQRSPENHAGANMHPYVRAANITWDGWDLTDVKRMNFDEKDFETFRLWPGDVLLNEGSGSADEVGKPAIWQGQIADCCFQNTLLRFRSEHLDPRFVCAFLKFSARQGNLIEHTKGVNIFHIGKKNLERLPLPVPPLSEQRRIVAKLDALFARLARARAELDRCGTLFIRLRRQIYDTAVSGELVSASVSEVWSEADRLSIAEHRRKYLAERKGSRLRSGLENDIDFLNDARSGWLNCRLTDVISLRVGHAFKSTQYSDQGVLLLRGANVAPDRIDWTDSVRVSAVDAKIYAELVLVEGDIVLAMDRPVISTGLKIARVSTTDAGCLLVQRVANPRPSRFVQNDYLAIVLRSRLFKEQIEGHATGSDLPHISGNDILTTPCPLPPLELQRKIVDRVGQAIAHIDRLEAEAARARALLDRLEAAILTKAFKGELVPQDPNDEPASGLLERIRAQRTAAVPVARAKRGRRAQ